MLVRLPIWVGIGWNDNQLRTPASGRRANVRNRRTQIYNVGYCDVRFGDAAWVDWMASMGAKRT